MFTFSCCCLDFHLLHFEFLFILNSFGFNTERIGIGGIKLGRNLNKKNNYTLALQGSIEMVMADIFELEILGKEMTSLLLLSRPFSQCSRDREL